MGLRLLATLCDYAGIIGFVLSLFPETQLAIEQAGL
jgi:hypothetical protein